MKVYNNIRKDTITAVYSSKAGHPDMKHILGVDISIGPLGKIEFIRFLEMGKSKKGSLENFYINRL